MSEPQLRTFQPALAAFLLLNWWQRLVKTLGPHWQGCKGGLPEDTPVKVGAVLDDSHPEGTACSSMGGPGATASLTVRCVGTDFCFWFAFTMPIFSNPWGNRRPFPFTAKGNEVQMILSLARVWPCGPWVPRTYISTGYSIEPVSLHNGHSQFSDAG